MVTHASYSPYTTDTPQSRFKHSGKLLQILFVLMVPALALLYVSTRFHIRLFYLACLWLNLFLLGCAAIVVIISGILGVLEERKYQRLAHPNQHPRPRR